MPFKAFASKQLGFNFISIPFLDLCPLFSWDFFGQKGDLSVEACGLVTWLISWKVLWGITFELGWRTGLTRTTRPIFFDLESTRSESTESRRVTRLRAASERSRTGTLRSGDDSAESSPTRPSLRTI